MSGWNRLSVPRGDFGIEGADRRLMRAEIIEQGAGDGGLADAALVGAHENDCWPGHSATLQNEVTTGWNIAPPRERWDKFDQECTLFG